MDRDSKRERWTETARKKDTDRQTDRKRQTERESGDRHTKRQADIKKERGRIRLNSNSNSKTGFVLKEL